MDGRAAMLLLMVLMSASLTMADLCDSCGCFKNVNTGLVYLNCWCSRNNDKKLDFTLGFLKTNRGEVESMDIYDCPEVVFRNGLVNGLTHLKTLTVSNVSSLKIEANSLGSMNSIVVQDVDNLELEPRALYGITIKELRIMNVAVGKLESDTLNLREMESLQLSNSKFTKVENGAISVAMGSKSQFFVGDCHFGTVESTGVVVTSVSKAIVVRTSFESLKDNGFRVMARDVVVFDHSRVGADVSRIGLCISAKEVTVTSNFFDWYPQCINPVSISPTQRLLFKNNTALKGPFDVGGVSGSAHYVDNSFQCKCRNISGNQQEKVPEDIRNLLDNNFCFSKKCPKSVSLAMFERHLQSGARCDDEQLCTLSGSPAAHVLPLVATLLTVQLVAVLVV